ncbi:MAG: SDR family oxidoreductase [Solirubrobacteraceae bacterium]|nr:SDR family oxidoreductase [Patulibacter sp.]
MTQELSETTALVTGATAGIGRAVALHLASEGATVVVHGRDAARGAEVVDEIEAAGGSARFVAADLSDPADVARLAAEAGDGDVLVNNAGIYAFASTLETTVDVFDAHFAVNTRAPYLLVAALAPGMAERGRGSIVNVTTVAATTPMASGGVYGASKAAIELLTRTWADEFGAAGVRVNAVSPGPVHTPGTSVMGDGIEAIGRTTIAQRVAEPEEIAEAIVFLASPRASYVNGTTLTVHGGAPALTGA